MYNNSIVDRSIPTTRSPSEFHCHSNRNSKANNSIEQERSSSPFQHVQLATGRVQMKTTQKQLLVSEENLMNIGRHEIRDANRNK